MNLPRLHIQNFRVCVLQRTVETEVGIHLVLWRASFCKLKSNHHAISNLLCHLEESLVSDQCGRFRFLQVEFALILREKFVIEMVLFLFEEQHDKQQRLHR